MSKWYALKTPQFSQELARNRLSTKARDAEKGYLEALELKDLY